MSRELLARAWQAGAGPGDGPLTIDLDSTICETYGLAKEGARHHGYTGKRGYHPLLAIAAGTGDVLMSRLREGRANTARGAAHFLRETVSRVRRAGASGQLTARADSGFYAHALVAACREMDVRFSITIRRHKSLRNLIEAIPDADWTPVPYWMDGAADVAQTTYTPFRTEPGAAPVRLIVRRVKPTPGSQLALFATYSYRGFITDRDGETLELEADHRRHAEIENAIRDLKYGVDLNHMPSGRFAANGAWLAVQVMAHNLARWTARIGLGEQIATTKTLRRRFFSLAGRLTRSARRPPCICHSAGLGKPSSVAPWHGCAPCHSRPDDPSATDPPSGQLNVPANSRQSRSASASSRVLSRHLAQHSHCRPPSAPPKAPATARQPPVYPNSSPDHRACNSLPPLPLSSRPPSGSIGGFGLTHPPDIRRSPQTRASPVRECLLLRALPAISPCATSTEGHKVSRRRPKADTGPIYPNRARIIAFPCLSSHIPLM